VSRLPRLLLVVVAALGLGLAGCGAPPPAAPPPAAPPPAVPEVGTTSAAPAGPYRGLALDPPQPRPVFTLTDTSGQRYDFAARTRGRPTFLFFGYTECPDVCPTTMADVGVALRGVPAGVRRAVQVVFVTTDPKHDTGPVLARWLRSFDPGLPNRFVGLTGSLSQVVAAQVAARVPVATDGGQTHSAELLLFGTDDYARVVYLNGSSPDDMRHDLPAIAG
jgi:protein SCO1/2